MTLKEVSPNFTYVGAIAEGAKIIGGIF